MQSTLRIDNKDYTADLASPLDISLPLISGKNGVNCFNAPPFNAKPYTNGPFIGSLEEGAPVNFFDIQINPHGNGTHTECVGHILKGPYTINKILNQFVFPARLISVRPEKTSKRDYVISKEIIQQKEIGNNVPALIIRTRPNLKLKKSKNYNNTNPPYFTPGAMKYIVKKRVQHLLVDLPSVDKEKDGGKLRAHHIFWRTKGSVRSMATITELIFVDNKIKDGLYLLNLQIISLELDASPSKPVIYMLKPVKKIRNQ